MKFYNPSDWYWVVNGDQNKVFYSKVGDYVPISDPAFLAWKLDGTVPSAIDSEVSLGIVLAQAVVRPVTAGVLDAYTGVQVDGILVQTIFKVIFNHENRIRVLEGKPQITVAQARAAIKALM